MHHAKGSGHQFQHFRKGVLRLRVITELNPDHSVLLP